ncbi:MAG: hypothetical protein EOP83_31365, partial [Verrucomicrobiaceae bacterium]
MIRQRLFRALGPIWRFHRWFDDLERMKMSGERFLIFITMVITFTLLFPMLAVACGFQFFAGQMVGMMFF